MRTRRRARRVGNIHFLPMSTRRMGPCCTIKPLKNAHHVPRARSIFSRHRRVSGRVFARRATSPRRRRAKSFSRQARPVCCAHRERARTRLFERAAPRTQWLARDRLAGIRFLRRVPTRHIYGALGQVRCLECPVGYFCGHNTSEPTKCPGEMISTSRLFAGAGLRVYCTGNVCRIGR